MNFIFSSFWILGVNLIFIGVLSIRAKEVPLLILQRFTIESSEWWTTKNSSLPKSESFTENLHDLTRISKISAEGKIKSICVQSGLWAIFNDKNYESVSGILYASGQAEDRACTNDDTNGTSPAYKSIRHIGNTKLQEAGVSFYTQPFFAGDELYFDGFSLHLKEPLRIRSFGFTGKDNWTVFENPENQGLSVCLLSAYTGESRLYDAVVYNKDLNLTVGSVRRGCDILGVKKQLKSLLIFPTGEIRSAAGTWSDFKKSESLDSFELKSEEPGQLGRILSDGDELRLPRPSTQVFSSTVQGDSNWTVFSGTSFNGKTRCFFSESVEEALIGNSLNLTSQDPVRLEVGSIQRGCTKAEAQRDPRVLEDLDTPEGIGKRPNDNVLLSHPATSIFFTSFLIGLAILIFVILLGISLIFYFHCRSRRRSEE